MADTKHRRVDELFIYARDLRKEMPPGMKLKRWTVLRHPRPGERDDSGASTTPPLVGASDGALRMRGGGSASSSVSHVAYGALLWRTYDGPFLVPNSLFLSY